MGRAIEIARQELLIKPTNSLSVTASLPRDSVVRILTQLINNLGAKSAPGFTGDRLVTIRQMGPPVMDDDQSIAAPWGAQSPDYLVGSFAVADGSPEAHIGKAIAGIMDHAVNLKASGSEGTHKSRPARREGMSPAADTDPMGKSTSGDGDQ